MHLHESSFFLDDCTVRSEWLEPLPFGFSLAWLVAAMMGRFFAGAGSRRLPSLLFHDVVVGSSWICAL